MSRAPLITLILLAAVAVSLLMWVDGEPVYTLEEPELRAAPGIEHLEEAGSGEAHRLRIGSFDPPEWTPAYTVLEERLTGRDGARAVRLLVDTRVRSEDGLELITRALKARYPAYDAVSVEFTDVSDVLDYNGGALIFNTPSGAYYMGFIYGPPNNRGYFVKAAE